MANQKLTFPWPRSRNRLAHFDHFTPGVVPPRRNPRGRGRPEPAPVAVRAARRPEPARARRPPRRPTQPPRSQAGGRRSWCSGPRRIRIPGQGLAAAAGMRLPCATARWRTVQPPEWMATGGRRETRSSRALVEKDMVAGVNGQLLTLCSREPRWGLSVRPSFIPVYPGVS